MGANGRCGGGSGVEGEAGKEDSEGVGGKREMLGTAVAIVGERARAPKRPEGVRGVSIRIVVMLPIQPTFLLLGIICRYSLIAERGFVEDRIYIARCYD